MATCKDCLHEKVCVWNAELEQACNEDCSDFKNKADYAEVKHGKWEKRTFIFFDNEIKDGYYCSECNTTWDTDTKYCPNCGALMEREGRSKDD